MFTLEKQQVRSSIFNSLCESQLVVVFALRFFSIIITEEEKQDIRDFL